MEELQQSTLPPDMVNRPPHYAEGKTLGIETIDVIQNELTKEEFVGYLKGQIIKYVSRMGKKSGIDDAGKIAWYAQKLKQCCTEAGNGDGGR